MRNIKLSALCFAFCTINAQAFEFDTSSNTFQFGGGYTSGNAKTANISTTITTELAYKEWSYSSDLAAELTTANDIEAARSLGGNVELNRALSPRAFTFIKGSMIYDKYATFDFIARESIGIGRVLYKNETHKLSIQTGPGFLHRRIAGSEDCQNRPFLNISNKYSWQISEHAKFKQSLSANIDNVTTHIDLSTSLRTKIVKDLGVELSANINYDTKIPPLSQNPKKLDTNTKVTIVYSF